MSGRLFQQSQELLDKFTRENWPQTVLFSGAQTGWKKETILKAIEKTLWSSKTSDRLDEPAFYKMMESGDHPDFYHYGNDRIKIGDKKNPEKGSIRHMLEHFLVFSPKLSSRRFVFFEDASQILNEAESALLKCLEEPPAGTHFVLSVDEPSKLKETIISRCLEIPLNWIPDLSQTPVDPWERFWFFSEWNETLYFEKLAGKGYLETIKDNYDKLKYNDSDFMVFEELGWTEWKKNFSDESQDTQAVLLRIIFYPLYSALRDKLINGQAPEISPVSLPAFSNRKLLMLRQTMETFFQRLDTRYFGTRLPAMNVVFFGFLSKWMRIWSADIK